MLKLLIQSSLTIKWLAFNSYLLESWIITTYWTFWLLRINRVLISFTQLVTRTLMATCQRTSLKRWS